MAQVLVDLADEVETARARITQAVGAADSELRALRDRLANAAAHVPALLSSLDEELRRIQSERGSEPMDGRRYVDAVEERTALQPIVDQLSRREEEMRTLRTRRRELLRRLQDERRHAFAVRRNAAAEVNQQLAGTLEMTVSYLGDTGEFTRQLGAILKGSRVSSDAVDTITARPGTDGVELAFSVADGAQAVSEHFGLSDAMSQRLVDWLTDEPARLRDVEVLAPQDSVSIALIVDGKSRDLAQLSSGQKATALLLLAFAQGGRPLILDQPEDDLDNRFVYDDVVPLIRREKGVIDPARRRQIITATHNANILVNGDAELVLSLVDDNGRCSVRTRASIDDATVREEIRTVLEGGADAFRRRAEKYGGLDDA